ncbi:hypothetical protein [Ornithinimicrobium pekingense]|uniref:Uncharacterized protein n=1 Tax=Ornithinimicrobium pekingense TaxID=384677 RepID=A0ABQ2FCC6_9MICO|nr:hypothetical protein [Ornithinimicrobium pekingense]GGK75112.1 hypothetical protein GCM10011509_24740 [Ornithinimicrobium pekingense]
MMAERLEDDSGWTTVEEHHTALLNLHARVRDPDLPPGFRRAPTGQALHTLARASLEQVPVSARVGVLGDLARGGFPDWESAEPQYRELAASVAGARSGVQADRLLDDLKLSTSEAVPFSTTPSGQALPHHETAFVGEDVCTVRTVDVGGLRATWVYSEFETDAAFADVADWVDPRSWPRRGPMLFKGMEVVGSQAPVDLPAPPRGDEHWHGIFHEEVQLVRRVDTLLHCDYWCESGRSAGMTYDLALSLDDQIDVDRGFLSVVDVGGVRQVRALKIVGFREDLWDDLARLVCPFWTDWVRAAVEGGQSSRPAGGEEEPHTPGTTMNCSWLEPAEEWIDFLGDSSRTYVSLLDEMAGEAMRPDVRAADLARHQRRIFSQLAKDWSQAWMHGITALAQVADEGLERGIAPPGRTGGGAAARAHAFTGGGGARPAGVEGTVIPLGVPAGQEVPAPVVSDLVAIEAGAARIPAGAVTTTVEPLGQGHAVRLQVQAAAWSPGLYVGEVTLPGGAPVPVQLYVSRSTEV